MGLSFRWARRYRKGGAGGKGGPAPDPPYRLLNLKLVTEKQFQEMKQLDADGVSRAVGELLGLTEVSADENLTAFYRRYLVLALEAYRREKISHRKLVEIGSTLGVQAGEIQLILAKLGLDDEPAGVLLPSR